MTENPSRQAALFLQLLLGLQQSGMMALGKLMNPLTRQIEKNLDGLLREGVVTADEGRALVATMVSGLSGESEGEFEALLVRKAGLSLWLLVSRGGTPRFEESARVVARIDLGARLEELKSLLAADEGKTR